MSGTASPYPDGSIALDGNSDDGDDGNSDFNTCYRLEYTGTESGSLHLLSELMLTKTTRQMRKLSWKQGGNILAEGHTAVKWYGWPGS